jgi:trimeric autotransporter adhesin
MMNACNRLVLWATMALLSANIFAASFVVTTTADSGPGSLRQAILDANSTAGADTITFGFRWFSTITPLSPLPAITDTVGIYALNNGRVVGVPKGLPTIELNGSVVGVWGSGLWIGANGCAVKGLIINRFGTAIAVNGNGNTIDANYIGTDATGTVALRNTVGIYIDGNGNYVGVGGRNLISGNDIGILIGRRGGFKGWRDRNALSTGNVIQNNYIGTDITGLASLPNVVGIELGWAYENWIGGESQGRNIISGNGTGIRISERSAFTYVFGNYIGPDKTGMVPLTGNRRGNGVAISLDGGGNFIGSRSPGSGNLIAGSGNVIAFNDQGVVVHSGEGHWIVGNSIHSQAIGLGIDLAPLGVTPNDAGDVDSGANYLINFPELSDAVTDGVATIISGTKFTNVPSPYIDFYSSPQCHPSGYGEGKTYLGTIDTYLIPDPNKFVETFPVAVPVGHFITATAEDGGGTSEFSRCIRVRYPD